MEEPHSLRTPSTPGTEKGSQSDHLANERTFLAWVRTSIAIMAFGFVVVKFSLFLKQLSFIVQKPSFLSGKPQSSSAFGITIVGIGALIGILAFVQYRRTGNRIEQSSYHPSRVLPLLVTLAVAGIGLFLVLYLLSSAR